MNLILLLILSLISSIHGRECFTSGECRDSYPVTGSIVEDQYECRKKCQDTSKCAWFTFYQGTSYCQLFKNCVNQTDALCPDCFSGAKDCLAPELKCRLIGKCAGDLLFKESVENEQECLETCKSNSTCKWFTFETDTKICNSYTTCTSLEGCDTCITGNSKCNVNASDSEWHLIIGGAGSPNTVELFNWYTNQQCKLPDLPVGVYGHVAAFMEGTPVFCEAGAVRKGCYKMEKKSKKWVSISSLLSGVEYGKSVYVPSVGWVVFGRLGNELNTAQLLPKLDGTWRTGPKLIEDFHKEGQCIVQVNDIKTVFFDNSERHSSGYYNVGFLDWSTMTFTTSNGQYYNHGSKRFFRTCALVKGQQKDTFYIAMTRGSMDQGLESYSVHGTYISELTNKLPPEKNQPTGLGFSQLLSINNGSELLLYGGQVDDVIQDGIWKYSVATKRWMKVGTMMHPRSAHTVIPVTGLTCN